MKIYLLQILLLSSYLTYSQQCPPEGTGKDAQEKALNVEKNKPANIPSAHAKTIALSKFITKERKPDRDKFTEGEYVTVTGYIVDFQEEGKETSNCGLATVKKKDGDVHIYFGLVADAAKKNCMIVEITPAFKKLHPDYSTLLLKGSKVKVYGYLIYDYLHEPESLSTCTSCDGAWRKTCWEIHPVTKIVLL